MMHDLPPPKEPIPHVMYFGKATTTAIQIVLGLENNIFRGEYKISTRIKQALWNGIADPKQKNVALKYCDRPGSLTNDSN